MLILIYNAIKLKDVMCLLFIDLISVCKGYITETVSCNMEKSEFHEQYESKFNFRGIIICNMHFISILILTRQMSSMIHSVRPTVSPVANIVFTLLDFEKWGRTDGRTTCAKTMIPTGRDFGLAKWINTSFGSKRAQ